MDSVAVAFFFLNACALLLVPRGWALLPIVLSACYITLAQGIVIGPYRFPVLRLIILVGFLRVMLRGERFSGINKIDVLLVSWAAYALFSSRFHENPGEALTFRLGMAYNVLGIYFLTRIFCRSTEDARQLVKILAIALAPVALEMLSEQITGRNAFATFGGVPEIVKVRAGRLRAQGPFAHPILAGSVGAVCIPLMISVWRQHRLIATIGIVSSLLMVVASASSGPLMSVIFGVFAIALWKWRHLTRRLRIGFVFVYIFLEVVMNAPAYFLIARIDLTGGSTGFHRAELIRQSFAHLNEWWLAGTDYTRHWMVTGVSWSTDHVDITNYYIKMGVIGGLPLMLLLIAAIGFGFAYVGQSIRAASSSDLHHRFLLWCIGASLFSHAATCTSVSYFDQSFIFLFFTLAIISSLRQHFVATESKERSMEVVKGSFYDQAIQHDMESQTLPG